MSIYFRSEDNKKERMEKRETKTETETERRHKDIDHSRGPVMSVPQGELEFNPFRQKPLDIMQTI